MAKNSTKVQLGFGAMRLPQTDENDPSTIDMVEFTEMVDYYMKQGFNYFDTSYAYHGEKSENAEKEFSSTIKNAKKFGMELTIGWLR